MRFLMLGVVALVLFGVSAALSIWLYQSRQTTEATDKGDKKKADPAAKDPTEPRDPPARPPAGSGLADAAAVNAGLKLEAERLAARSDRVALVLKDIQGQREAVDLLVRQVAAELKLGATRAAELDTRVADLQRRQVELDATEQRNLARFIPTIEAMDPEAAAPILRQMAESGKLDTVVKIVAGMQQRRAGAVLAAMNDAALAGQIIGRVQSLSPPPPAGAPGGLPGPAGATGNVPAGGLPPKTP